MANIIPRLTKNEIENIHPRSERKVYRALLEQLPDEWLVIHSLEFIMQTSSYKSHGDREADFVVFAPEYGILVIEVKGGGIEYNSEKNQWYSINSDQEVNEIKNPIKQAKNAKYEISKHLKKQMPYKKLLLAHGALFPDIHNLNALVNPAARKEILASSEVLEDIKTWIISLFDFWAGEQPIFDPLEISGVNIANDIYGKNISIQQSLASKIEEEIERQIILTNQQKNILRQLKKRKEAVIEGGAGTGKTVLALDHAQALAGQGLKVLLLCYNQKLGNVLKEKSEGIDDLHPMSFHQFCYWRMEQAKSDTGRDLLIEASNNYPDENKYDVWMPSALIDSYDLSPISYDVIIVDEGQDFKEEYWFAIEELRERNSETQLYIFKDSNQAIYASVDDLPIDVEPLYLFDNCRNTKTIHNLAYQFYRGEEMEAPDLEGEPIQFLSDNNLEKQAQFIDQKIARLINEENIKPKDIAVIVLDNYKTAEEFLRRTRNKKLWAFQEFSPKDHVLIETAKRFKGLEANIIFLWVLDSSNMEDKLLYVSISRARFRLWVVGDPSIDQIVTKRTYGE